MNDPQLAAALRSRSPDALPELLDAYGDQLFSYCWCLLRNRENAQIAVRDALERYHRPQPDAGEELLHAPVKPVDTRSAALGEGVDEPETGTQAS